MFVWAPLETGRLQLMPDWTPSLRATQATLTKIGVTTEAMTQDDLREYVDFNRDFLSAVEAAKREGKSVEEFVKTWTTPARYKGYAAAQPALLQRNVEGMYKELR